MLGWLIGRREVAMALAIGVAGLLWIVAPTTLLEHPMGADGLIADEPPVTLRLVSARVREQPNMDGALDMMWQSAPPVGIPLIPRGSEGSPSIVWLRSVHTDTAIYFYAEWASEEPHWAADTIHNALTVHFDMAEPWPGAGNTTCLVACHTAFVDGAGRVGYVSAETIPPGTTDSLSTAGGWADGGWRLEWGRPLTSDNLFDVQFRDLDQPYTFFIKLFEHVEGRDDPLSRRVALLFQR